MKISTDIGKLNQRLVILQKKVATDEIGNQKETWTPYHVCWGSVSGVSGREYWAAREQHEEGTVNFKIRYCAKLAGLTSTDFRIAHKGEIYDITSIDNTDAADSMLTIKGVCRSGNSIS